jgi:hypothetical protein
MNSGLNYGAGNGFIVGGVTGAIAGGISSLAQNGVMNNSRYGSKWFGYSFFSWAITFAIGFAISWDYEAPWMKQLALRYLLPF